MTVKVFGISLRAAGTGYLIGLVGGMVVVETFSTNVHDKSMEAAMTGAFVFGPLMAFMAPLLSR
jgi:hypothetical protein